MDSVLQAGVVSAPLQVIIDRLATLAVTETSLILGADDEARKLQRTLERIRAMVGHVEESRSIFSNSISNEAWKVWLEDVEKLIYSADDLLDGISLDLAKRAAHLSVEANSDRQVRDMVFCNFQLTLPHGIGKIRQQLEDIAKEMDALFMTELTRLGSGSKLMKSNSDYTYYSCATSSVVNEGFVVGRERQRDEIVGMLMDDDMWGSNVSVIPVVGMGGIGKTTLAQVVYNDERVVERFRRRVWASVSMDFDAVRIGKSIIESLTGECCMLGGLDPVLVKLRDLLKGERFLIVLDDYWSEEYGNWDVLSSPFGVGLEGSKVVVTTRSMTVSRIVGSVESYDLELLNDDDCWALMKQRAFLNRRTWEERMLVEEIGRMIARKCKGLPLAAKTLGSMLRFKNDVGVWKSILKSEIWDLPKYKNDILPALTLSCRHLPAHLKKCFAYCSIFPKNYEFEIDELVLLWMAEGFIRPDGKVRLEDLGANYFNDLLSRSLFQFSHVNVYGKQIYKMHDLIQSMAQLVSSNTCFCSEHRFSTEGGQLLTSNVRHLSLHRECVQPMMLKPLAWYKNLRTFRVMFENIGTLQVSYDLFLKLESLRVLGLSHMGLNELPDSIDHLKHLRYLNISGNPIKKLPKSITKLFGLQTLKLERCLQLLELPNDMKNMVSLRHLHLDVKQLNHMPPEFGRLVNLQSLCAFIVGRSKGCGIGELKNMRFLRGSICIKNLEDVSKVDEAKEAMLGSKPYLEKLELEWNDLGSRDEEAILAGLCPHENLKELLITNYKGFLFPSWLSSPLCNLSSIHLRRCQHHSIVAPLGKLQHLKSLHVQDMSDWFCIDQEFLGFPALVSLTIEDLPNLADWKGILGENSCPSLQSLSIMDCPKLTNLPSLKSLICLKFISINRCLEIQALPEEGFSASLQQLVIVESDIIRGRCRSGEGEDWYKIIDIPKVEIDYVEIHTGRRRIHNFL